MFCNSIQEEKMIRDSMIQFTLNELEPDTVVNDEGEIFDSSIIDKMKQMDLIGNTILNDIENFQIDYSTYCIILEEIGKVNCSYALTLANINTCGIEPFHFKQNTKDKNQFYNGEEIAASIFVEEKDLEIDEIGDGIMIKGFVQNVINGNLNNTTLYYLIFSYHNKYYCVQTEKCSSMAIKEKCNKLGLRSANICCVNIEDFMLAKKYLDESEISQKQYVELISNYRLSIAAIALGASQSAYNLAYKYVKERSIFNKLIIEFPINYMKFVEMKIRLESSRNNLYNACRLKNMNENYEVDAIISEISCIETMGFVSDHAIQLLGGYGLTCEYQVERIYRDYKMLSNLKPMIKKEKHYMADIILK